MLYNQPSPNLKPTKELAFEYRKYLLGKINTTLNALIKTHPGIPLFTKIKSAINFKLIHPKTNAILSEKELKDLHTQQQFTISLLNSFELLGILTPLLATRGHDINHQMKDFFEKGALFGCKKGLNAFLKAKNNIKKFYSCLKKHANFLENTSTSIVVVNSFDEWHTARLTRLLKGKPKTSAPSAPTIDLVSKEENENFIFHDKISLEALNLNKVVEEVDLDLNQSITSDEEEETVLDLNQPVYSEEVGEEIVSNIPLSIEEPQKNITHSSDMVIRIPRKVVIDTLNALTPVKKRQKFK